MQLGSRRKLKSVRERVLRIMQRFMGIITNTKSEEVLNELTQHRCMSAVPFGGRYRLIDFPLSNMVNSGVRNVGIITSNKYRALMDHLGAGKEWGLDRKSDGLFFLPSASPSIFRKTLKFDLKDFYANFDYIEKCKQRYVIISGNNMIFNLNYNKIFQYHQEKGADITLSYKEEKFGSQDYSSLHFLELDSNSRVIALHKTPSQLEINKTSIETVIMERKLLLEIIKVALSSGNWDLADVLMDNIEELKVYAYGHKGYLGKITSVQSYYKHTMDLLDKDVWNELFFGDGPIYTKIKDSPPTKYWEESDVKDVLVAAGCSIRGKVEGSVIFRGVLVDKGAVVKNSIIMQKSIIEKNVHLENVILDKEVVIRKGAVLKGEESHPIVIGKKTVI